MYPVSNCNIHYISCIHTSLSSCLDGNISLYVYLSLCSSLSLSLSLLSLLLFLLYFLWITLSTSIRSSVFSLSLSLSLSLPLFVSVCDVSVSLYISSFLCFSFYCRFLCLPTFLKICHTCFQLTPRMFYLHYMDIDNFTYTYI